MDKRKKMKMFFMRHKYCLLLIVLIFFLFSCRDRDAVIIAGSTSVQPYAEVLVEEFMILNPQNVIDIQGGGSSAGITAVETGTAEIGMSSRFLKDSEKHLWSIEIAKDGLAMIVNPRNPIQNLTINQIRGIYTADIKNWSELGGSNARIHIIAREEGSGTRSAFEEMMMDGRRITPRAIVQASNGAVRQLVAGDPHSIGFISLGLVDETVKAISLHGVPATRENIINGTYELYRPFLFISKEQPVDTVMEFIDFILSPEGQRLLADEGLIPE
jgi:phosphate transport system substrate-binding protein